MILHRPCQADSAKSDWAKVLKYYNRILGVEKDADPGIEEVKGEGDWVALTDLTPLMKPQNRVNC